MQDVLCFACNNYGHFAHDCPRVQQQNGDNGRGCEGVLNFYFGIGLTQQLKREIISKTWILLDLCSTNSVTNNLKFVANVKQCFAGQELLALTNGGSKQYDHEGDFIFLPMKVYVKEDSLATILSMK